MREYETKNNLQSKVYYISKFIIIFIVFFFIYNIRVDEKGIQYIEKNHKDNHNITNTQLSKLLSENFFVIDSNNLDKIIPHMFGFCISKDGILTDNYYKQIGEYEEPLPQGIYIMIRKVKNQIIINQDFYGSFGLYIYENKDEKYFAISNSFLLLEEYLVGKQKMSLNKDFADNLIVTYLCSFSLDETLIKEIKQIPSNAVINIDIKRRSFNYDYINYKENTIPLESEEGLKIIDDWIDKWAYIFRSLKKQTDNLSADLSGGFDTRTMLPILLNSGIDMKELNVHSIIDKKHDHDIDYNIASNISSFFGFRLNNFVLDNNVTVWNTKDILYNTLYSKLGFHKEFYMKNIFYNKPRFSFTGSGGESLRGTPSMPIEKFMEILSLKNIKDHEEEFFKSSMKFLNRSISILKKEQMFNNEYEISYSLYSKTVGRNHFGKAALENFMTNIYILQPLMDPDIKKIKFDVCNSTSHDLISYIYVRFAHNLINFPFQGNRILNVDSIKKAEELNNKLKPYKIKFNYNKNFYIDQNRTSPVFSSSDNRNAYECLGKIFKSPKYFNTINKIYDKNVYQWANEYINKTDYHPFSQHYALLAVAITLDLLSMNEKYTSELEQNTDFKKSKFLDDLINR